jgi:hypothetical protein
MPATAKSYIRITVALGFALLLGSLIWFRQFPDVPRYLACLSLACIASTMKVRLPGFHGTISVNFVFILMGIAQLSLAETLTMAAAATLVQSLWRPKTQPKTIQVMFNASTVVISTALAYSAAHLVPGEVQMWAALAPAATVFFITNTGMISLVLALMSKTSVLVKWRQCHLWTFPYYLVGAAIAAAVSTSSQAMGWRVSLLVLPMMFLVYCYFTAYVSAQQGDRRIQ